MNDLHRICNPDVWSKGDGSRLRQTGNPVQKTGNLVAGGQLISLHGAGMSMQKQVFWYFWTKNR